MGDRHLGSSRIFPICAVTFAVAVAVIGLGLGPAMPRALAMQVPATQVPGAAGQGQTPFGDEARGFASGAFATATTIELLRAPTLDPYGRTLGYLFVNGKNYSVLIITARLAEESVTRYGDNGFPQEAAAVLKAARAAGPLPFESPAAYRARMKGVSEWMKAHGAYPATQ